jgi:hypothetical protein
MLSLLEVVPNGINENSSMVFHEHLFETCASLELQLWQASLTPFGFASFELAETSEGYVDHVIFVVELEGEFILD